MNQLGKREFPSAKASMKEETFYHSKIDLVGAGVSKKSLRDTNDGVLRSWFHMVPPTKGPAWGWHEPRWSSKSSSDEPPHDVDHYPLLHPFLLPPWRPYEMYNLEETQVSAHVKEGGSGTLESSGFPWFFLSSFSRSSGLVGFAFPSSRILFYSTAILVRGCLVAGNFSKFPLTIPNIWRRFYFQRIVLLQDIKN